MPAARPTVSAMVHRVPWKPRTPTVAESSDVRTTWPLPVRSRSCSAAISPYAPYMPPRMSEIGVPTFCGSSAAEPVIDIRPASPWAIWS